MYNEERTILTLLDRVLAAPLTKEVIVVDDCSTDASPALVAAYARTHPAVRLYRHALNGGRSVALRTGIRYATGTIIIPQDADVEYNPADYPALAQPILDGRADAVYGSRVLGNNRAHGVNKLYTLLGADSLNFLTNILYGTKLTDCCTGYKAVRRDILQQVDLRRVKNFTFCPTVTSYLAKHHHRILEVPIHYAPRTWKQGKKVKPLQDWSQHVFTLLEEKIRR